MAGPSLLIKKRLLFLLLAFTVLVFGLLVRLAWIQLFNGEWYQQKAFEQQTRDREIPPKRGTVFDRNGKVLAVSASVERIVASPLELKKSKVDIDTIASDIAQILNMPKEDVLKKIKRQSRYEVIKKKVDKEVGNQIRKWREEKKIEGIYIDEDTKRFYPNRNLAAHVVGFTGEDNQGLDGIERMMEQFLKGTPGKVLSEVDAGGREVPFKEEQRIDPKDGLNVVLTIDETIQHFATKALDKAIDDNKLLKGATAIIMDPRNGDILALVSKPDFDLNDPKGPPLGVDPSTWKGTTADDIKKLQETVWRNKAVTDTYEPGSTFKAFTSAAGLEEGVVTPDTPTSDKTITVQGKNINCWKPNAHGNEPFFLGVYNSCNPVFVKVAQGLGIEKFYKYVRAFGFYDKTGITLPGEARSQFHAKPIEIDMAVASFGQRFQVTPIQMAAAYASIANGGKLMKPRLVKELTDAEGVVVKKFEPEVVRNVISRKTSDTLRGILEGVVSEGTGKNAYVKGYRVAGKTGTSETLETPKNGRYIASFSAFAPADNPVITCIVILDHPTGDSYYGGQIAAPVAGKLIEDTLSYLEIERRFTEKDKEMLAEEVFVPDVRGKTIEEAKKLFKEVGLEYKLESTAGNSETIVDQTPKPGVSISKKSVVILYTYKPDREVMVMVPNVADKSLQEATQAFNNLGLNIRSTGIGKAVVQSRKPGELVPKGSIIEVEFRHLETD